MNQAEMTAEVLAVAEQSYNQLDGEWHHWLEVAKRYEHRVPSQDRYDIRHSILVELAKARHRDNKPIPQLRAYRIASLTVALYWRELVKHQVKVCIYSGLPKEPHCNSCSHQNAGRRHCPYLALRPIESLDTEPEEEGERLIDTIVDDHAIDLEAWLDARTWLLGCPMRLVQIAYKKLNGQALNKGEHCYLQRYRRKTQLKLFE